MSRLIRGIESKIENRPLSDVVEIKNGRDYKKLAAGNIPVYGSGGIIAYVDQYVYDKPSVLIPRKGSLDKLYFVTEPFWNVDTIFYTVIDTTLMEPKFLYYVLASMHLERLNKAGGVPSLTQSVLNKIHVPVPPLEVQQEIVRVLDHFTELNAELNAELHARHQQYIYYRNRLLSPTSQSTWMTLGDIGRVAMCKRIMKAETSPSGDVPFYKIGTFGKEPDAYISKAKYEEYRSKYPFPQKGDILISAAGTIGRTVIYDGEPAYYQDSNIVWVENDESIVLNRYLYYYYQLQPWSVSTGGTIARLYNDNICKARISVPPLPEQRRIVAILDRFDALCNDLTSGLPAEIAARQKQYEYYRDKLLTFHERSR